MGYLTNRTINYLNIHIALLGLLEQSYIIFVPIFLYKQGFSIPEVFLLLALFNAVRLPLRLFAFPLVHGIGLKYALMVGTAGFCITFPILSLVQGYDLWLACYTLAFGMFSALHWHCYHTFYSLAGEHEHRGKQLSVMLSLYTAVSALAPLLGALFIDHTGFQKFFLLPIPLLVVMLCILSRCENIPAARTPWREGKKLMFNLGAKIHFAESSAVYPLVFSWLFTVYFFVEKMVSLGSIITFGILVQILYQLWVGKTIDRGRGHFIAHAAGALRTVQVIAKALVPVTFPRILGLEALTGATNVHHALAQPTALYNAGKHSADPFWYWMFAEAAFDVGTILGAGGVALLLWLGVPLQLTILLALPGVLGVWWLTNHYYDALRDA